MPAQGSKSMVATVKPTQTLDLHVYIWTHLLKSLALYSVKTKKQLHTNIYKIGQGGSFSFIMNLTWMCVLFYWFYL